MMMTINSERNFTSFLYLLALFMLPTFLFYNFVIPRTAGRMARASSALIPDFPLWTISYPLPTTPSKTAVLHFIIIVICFVIYTTTVYLAWRMPSTRRRITAVFVTTALFWLTSVFAVPTVGTDIFNYILRGRIAAVYGENPYYTAADTYPNDIIYPYASHRYTAHPGGKFPTWMLFNIGLARLGSVSDSPVYSLLLYRTALFLLNGLNLAFIGLILHRMAPRFVIMGLLIYGWNPIVVLFGQSKTDTLMVFWLLLGIWLLVREQSRWAMVALALSGFVKLITLPLAAVYLASQLWQRQWRPFITHSLVFGLTSLVVYLPFLRDLRPIQMAFVIVDNGGPPTNNTAVSTAAATTDIFATLMANLVPLGFLLLLIVAILWQNNSHERRIISWTILMLYFSGFLAESGLSWYLLTLFALVSLTQKPLLILSSLPLSALVFLDNHWNATFNSRFPAPDPDNLLPVLLLGTGAGLAFVVGLITLFYDDRANYKQRIADMIRQVRFRGQRLQPESDRVAQAD
ncbi:MAG: hypothetical protein AAF614_09560 [Chloroflexota bacterium]